MHCEYLRPRIVIKTQVTRMILTKITLSLGTVFTNIIKLYDIT